MSGSGRAATDTNRFLFSFSAGTLTTIELCENENEKGKRRGDKPHEALDRAALTERPGGSTSNKGS